MYKPRMEACAGSPIEGLLQRASPFCQKAHNRYQACLATLHTCIEASRAIFASFSSTFNIIASSHLNKCSVIAVHVSTYVCMCTHVYECIRIRMCMCMHACMGMCTYICASVHTYVHVRTDVRVHVRVNMSASLHQCLCVSVYVCACVSVCVRACAHVHMRSACMKRGKGTRNDKPVLTFLML